jgi:hypothetical protein
MDDKDTIILDSDDNISINVDDILSDTITIDTSSMDSSNYIYSNSGQFSIGAAGSTYGNITFNTGSSGYNGTWSSLNNNSVMTANGAGLHVTSDAEFEGDVKIKGVSIAKALEDIQKRLAILVPDPAKLEHFAALKKAYEHYKTLEALCEIPKQEEDN